MSEHLDGAVLAALEEVMGTEYPVLLDAFLSDSEERLHSLRQALQAGDAEAVRRAAHSFKGSCSNMGAPLLTELCRQLEEQAHAGRLDGAPELLEQLQSEYAIIHSLIQSERKHHP